MRTQAVVGALALLACSDSYVSRDASGGGEGSAPDARVEEVPDAARTLDAAHELDAAQVLDAGPLLPEDCFDPSLVRLSCEHLGFNEPLSDTPVTSPTLAPFVRATDFGADARFTHVGRYALLGERGEGSAAVPFVVHLTEEGFGEPLPQERAIERDAATEGYRAIAVDSQGESISALLCGDTRCVLFAASETGPLTASSGGAVPEGLTPRGLLHSYEGNVCVFGDGGFACFDGTGFGPRQLEGTNLHGLSDRNGWTAVGEGGAFFYGYASDDVSTEVDTGTTQTLVWGTYYDVTRGCWSAETQSGGVLDNCAEPFVLCDPEDSLRFARMVGGSGRFIHSSGNVYERTLRSHAEGLIWCALPKPPSEQAVIGSAVAPCGLINNWLLLTEQALYVASHEGFFCAID